MPDSVSRFPNCRKPGYLREPMWSKSRRTFTPRAAARCSAAKRTSVVRSQATI